MHFLRIPSDAADAEPTPSIPRRPQRFASDRERGRREPRRDARHPASRYRNAALRAAASCEPRCREPRASPATRDSSSGNASAAAPAGRPRVLGHRRPCVVAVGGVPRDRRTGDRDRMASAGLRSVVGVEVSPRGSAAPGAGAGEPHRADAARESAVEPAENRQRAGEARSCRDKDMVAKYMPKPAPRPRRPPSQTWKTFSATISRGAIAIDFLTVPTVAFHVL